VIPKPRSIYGDIHYSAGFAEFIWLGKERRSRDFKGGGEDDSASLEAQVLAAFRSFPDGATADQIVDHLGLRWNSVTPRFKRLMEQGLIEDTGRRVKGVSGRSGS